MLRAEGLRVGYQTPVGRLDVLRGAALTVERGERVGLGGPSGCGKSTLARVLALLEAPEGGRVLLDGVPVRGAGLTLPPRLRRRVHLLWQAPRPAVDPRYRLRRVIAEPLALQGELPRGASGDAEPLAGVAARVGLTADLLDRYPSEVSDGQLQRACLARALLAQPDVLVADELGAPLDTSTQASLLAVLAEEAERGMGVLLISHDAALLEHWCDRVLRLDDGRVGEADRR